MATPAHLITLGLNHALNGNIKGWFDQFNFLPPEPLQVSRADYVRTDETLEDLMQRLVDSHHRDFIIIIHGYSDGSGLYLKLLKEQSRLHTNHYDLQALMDADAGATLDGPLLKKMGITQRQADRLIVLMRKVRDKKIGLIEFRSCNLGRSEIALDRFRKFFGARRLGAPNLHTLFGLIPQVIHPEFQKLHLRAHHGAGWETYNFPVGLLDPELVCCFQLNKDQKPESGGHIATSTVPLLDGWIQEWLMSGGTSKKGQMLAVHALWVADVPGPVEVKGHKPRAVPAAIVMEPKDFTDPLGGFGGPAVRRFIPPKSVNYKKHIVYSPKGR